MDGPKAIKAFSKQVRLLLDDGTSMDVKLAILDKIQPMLSQRSFAYKKAGSTIRTETKYLLLQLWDWLLGFLDAVCTTLSILFGHYDFHTSFHTSACSENVEDFRFNTAVNY